MPETPIEAAYRLKSEIEAVATNIDETVKSFRVHDDGKKIVVTAITEDRNGAWTFEREAPYTMPEETPAVEAPKPVTPAIPTDVDLAEKTQVLGKTPADLQAEKDATAPEREAMFEATGAEVLADDGNHDPDPPHKTTPEEAASPTVDNPGDLTVGEQEQVEAAKGDKK